MWMKIRTISIAMIVIWVSGCGPKGYVKGDYDENVEEANLLTDKWSESDMQKAVAALVQSATAHPAISNATSPPIVMVTKIQNKTSEHIDTQSISDMIQVELMRTGRVTFVDKAAREDIAEELDYQASGTTSRQSQKQKGNQTGADFIMNGRLDSIVQDTGKDKTVYYKVTLNLTNLSTAVKVWTDHKQIRKRYSKSTFGL